MTRKSLRFWLVPLLLGPACALALEIGEIQVSSALNQLFDARIPLLALTPEESEKVSVSLASKAMFKEFGLERTSALTNLVFSIEYNAEGLVYVRAVSTQPIREPSLGLLLEFNWPRGKTFREFTVFLDPVQRLAKRPSDRTKTVLTAPEPVPAAPVAAPPVAATAPPTPPVAAPPVAATAPPTPPVAAPIVAPPSSEQTESSAESLPVAVSPPPVKTYKPGDNYGPITPGEGLWGIALKVRPDPSISREHMMQALLKANPQAFSKAGVDGLKIGAVLRIPTLREIVDLTGSLAARQLAEAESPSSPAPTIADQTPSDAAPAPPAAESARVVTGELETFPLAPQAIPEPTVVVAPSSSAPEAVEPKPESKSEPKPAVAEPAVAAAEPEAPKPEISKPVEPEAPKPEIVAAEPETPKPVVAAAEPEAPKPEISKPVEPEAPKPEIVAAEPEAPKPVVAAAEPEVPKPEIVATEPETPKPEIVATEPETPKPEIVAAELEAPKPAVSKPTEPETPKPETPKPEIVATEPETPKPEIVAVESEASKPAELEAPKSVVMEPKVALPADQTASVVTESSSQLLMEPVSVTPLLFLATSEMIATIAQVPVTSISMPIASPSSVTTGVVASKAKTKTTTVVERLPVIAALPATIDSEPSPLLMDATSLLAEIEKFVQQTSPDASSQSSQSSQSSPAIERATQPPIAELAAAPPVQAEAQPETHIDIAPEPQPSEASTSAEPANSESGKPSDATPVVKPSELSTEPAIHEPDQTLVESTVAEPIHSDYKGGDQYGPVSTNERLWDIAGKVRPNPGIGRDVMMKALFMANPQSFSKPDMNSLKVGAILRVPTLREIADYTDSKVARQLLEQQQATETQPAGAKAAGHSVPSASPATPPTETGGAVIHPAPATPSDGAAHEPSATPAAVQGGAIRDPRLAPPVVKVKLG